MRTLFLLSMIWVTPALAFDMDVSKSDLRAARGVLVVGDLATGEVGLTSYPNFCQQDGRLFEFANVTLKQEASAYGFTFRTRREPGNTLSIEVITGSKVTDENWRSTILGHLESASECRFSIQWSGPEMIEVSKINGYSTAAEIVAAK